MPQRLHLMWPALSAGIRACFVFVLLRACFRDEVGSASAGAASTTTTAAAPTTTPAAASGEGASEALPGSPRVGAATPDQAPRCASAPGGAPDPKPDPDDGMDFDGDESDADMPLSDLSLSTAKLPVGQAYRSISKMRKTINNYCMGMLGGRFWSGFMLGTLHSLQRRFNAIAGPIEKETTVEMRIAYKQLSKRLATYIQVFKALKSYNDSQNTKAFGLAGGATALLFKFYKARLLSGLVVDSFLVGGKVEVRGESQLRPGGPLLRTWGPMHNLKWGIGSMLRVPDGVVRLGLPQLACPWPTLDLALGMVADFVQASLRQSQRATIRIGGALRHALWV